MSKAQYTLQSNFISSNSYMCAEINGHGLIMLLINLKNERQPELFLPWLYSSQPCESFFKAARSFTPTESTQINFTLKDLLLNRCKKISASIQLTTLGDEDGIKYPRSEGEKCSATIFELPSLEEIGHEIDRAKSDAEQHLHSLGKCITVTTRSNCK